MKLRLREIGVKQNARETGHAFYGSEWQRAALGAHADLWIKRGDSLCGGVVLADGLQPSSSGIESLFGIRHLLGIAAHFCLGEFVFELCDRILQLSGQALGTRDTFRVALVPVILIAWR